MLCSRGQEQTRVLFLWEKDQVFAKDGHSGKDGRQQEKRENEHEIDQLRTRRLSLQELSRAEDRGLRTGCCGRHSRIGPPGARADLTARNKSRAVPTGARQGVR